MSNDQTDLKEVSKRKGSTFEKLKLIIEKLEETGGSYSIDELTQTFRVTPITMSYYMDALSLHFPVRKKKNREKDEIKYSLNIRKFTSIRSNLEDLLESAVREIDREQRGTGNSIRDRRREKFDRLLSVLEKLMEGRFAIRELESKLKDEFKMSRKSIERDIRDLSRIFFVQDVRDADNPRIIRYFVERRTIVRTRLNIKEQLALAMAKMGSPFGNSFADTLTRIEENAMRPAQPALDAGLMEAFVFTTSGDESEGMLQDKLLTLAEACYRKKCVQITYRTLATRITDQRNRSEINDRVIEPAYLFPAMDGLFYVMAFCQMRNDWRIFAVDQISTCESTCEQATKELSQDKKREVSMGFGPFIGGKTEEEDEFIIRFSPQIRPYIERRKWHISDTPETKKPITDEVFGEKSLELRLTTTGSEGVKHWLKQWIPHMRVVKPRWLKDELEEEMSLQLEHLKKGGK